MPEATYLGAITATLGEAMRADPRVFVLGEDVAEGPLQPEDRVELLPLRGRERLPVQLRVALVMTAEPMGEALEQERPLSRPRLLEEPAERRVHLEHLVAVDGLALELPRRHDVAHPLDGRVRRARRELREAVVLADEDRRQPPQRGQVHRLGEDAALHGAVAEEHDCDRVASGEARSERAAQRERDVAADDAGGAEEAVLDVDEVHRAAEAAAESAFAAHQLGHDALERRAFRDRVTVRAMAAVDGVVVAQLRADADRDRLLTRAQMDEAVDLVRAREPADPLLEDADPPHGAEELELVQAGTGASPSTCCTAVTTLVASGRR